MGRAQPRGRGAGRLFGWRRLRTPRPRGAPAQHQPPQVLVAIASGPPLEGRRRQQAGGAVGAHVASAEPDPAGELLDRQGWSPLLPPRHVLMLPRSMHIWTPRTASGSRPLRSRPDPILGP